MEFQLRRKAHLLMVNLEADRTFRFLPKLCVVFAHHSKFWLLFLSTEMEACLVSLEGSQVLEWVAGSLLVVKLLRFLKAEQL